MGPSWCTSRQCGAVWSVCQNFADELSFTFTVRWRGGKARHSVLAFNKLLHSCSTLAVGDHICATLANFNSLPFIPDQSPSSATNEFPTIECSSHPLSLMLHPCVPPSCDWRYSDLCKRTVSLLTPRASSSSEKIPYHLPILFSFMTVVGPSVTHLKMALLMPTRASSECYLSSTLRGFAFLRTFSSCRNRRVRTYTNLVPKRAEPLSSTCGPVTDKKSFSTQYGLTQFKSTRPSSPNTYSIFISSATQFFSTCRARHMSKKRYEKLRLDPDAFRAYRHRQAARLARYYDTNHEARRRRNEHSKEYFRHALQNTAYHDFHLLASWVRTYGWIRKTLPWKSHQPVLFNEPVKQYCEGCRTTKLHRVKLWWKSKPCQSYQVLASESEVERTDS